MSDAEGIEIVKKVECEGQVEIAMPEIQEVINSGLPFDNVSPDSKALINEGMMKATAAQFPSEIGKRAADVIYRLFDSENVDEDILIPVELITQENVNDFGIDRWQ